MADKGRIVVQNDWEDIYRQVVTLILIYVSLNKTSAVHDVQITIRHCES